MAQQAQPYRPGTPLLQEVVDKLGGERDLSIELESTTKKVDGLKANLQATRLEVEQWLKTPEVVQLISLIKANTGIAKPTAPQMFYAAKAELKARGKIIEKLEEGPSEEEIEEIRNTGAVISEMVLNATYYDQSQKAYNHKDLIQRDVETFIKYRVEGEPKCIDYLRDELEHLEGSKKISIFFLKEYARLCGYEAHFEGRKFTRLVSLTNPKVRIGRCPEPGDWDS